MIQALFGKDRFALLMLLSILGVAPQFTFAIVDGAALATDDAYTIDEDTSPFTMCVVDNDDNLLATAPLHIPLDYFLQFPATTGDDNVVATTSQVYDATCATASTPGNFNAIQVTLIPDANGTAHSVYASAGDGSTLIDQADCWNPEVIGTDSCGTITLTVLPLNDAPEIDDQLFANADENLANGTLVGTVSSSDPDELEGDGRFFSIISGNTDSVFSIDLTSGAISVAANSGLNFETNPLFNLTIERRDSAGLSDTGVVTIKLNDLNESPVVTGTFSGTVAEGNPGDVATATGSISISDVDVADNPGFNDVIQTGAYGTLSLVAGNWTYTLDQTAVQSLDATQLVTDTITLTATDSTTQDIVISITGSDDASVVTGEFIGAVTEGNIGDFAETAQGNIAIDDVDTSDSPAYSDTTQAGTYGSLTLTGGNWTYILDQSTVQSLDAAQLVTDTITLTATDSTTQDIVISITGSDDTPVVTGVLIGAVTEGNVGDPAETALGNIAISDVDTSDSPAYSDTTQAGMYGSLTLTGGNWTYTLDQSAVQSLDAAQLVTDTITLTATDSTTQDIVISITGSDDASVVTGEFIGAVTEGNIGDPAETAQGNIAIDDVDTSDSPAYSDTTQAGTYGSLTLTDGNWTYTLDQSAVQSLDTAQLVTDTITLTATDSTTQDIVISITGSDDTPVVTGVLIGAVTEGNIGDPAETALGNIAISDVDTSDSPAYSDTTQAGMYGSLTLTGGNWTYTLDQSAVQSLDTAQLVTDIITLTATDSTTQAIVISITGSDDASVVTGVFSGAVTEGNVGDPAETALGSIAISDVDASDSPAYSDTTQAGTYGSLTLTGGNWTYTLDQSTVQSLDAAQLVTDTITLIATDSTSQAIVISITGSNDSSVVTGVLTGAVTEGNIGDLAVLASGSISIIDADGSDTPEFSDVMVNGSYGTLVVAAGTWTYTLDQSSVQFLFDAQQVIDSFDLTATDATTQNIIITVTGSNDAPVVNDQTVSTDENLAGDTLVTVVGATDVDSGDTLTYSITAGLSAPAEFKINSSGEILVGDHTPDQELLNFEATPAYTLTVLVTDSLGLTATATITVNITDLADAPGNTVCEEFDSNGDSLNVLPDYLAPILEFYSFTAASPCHRVIATTDDYYMDQGKKLVAVSPLPVPADTEQANYRSLLSEIPKSWDQDSSTLHFTTRQNVTGLLATVAFTDEGGMLADDGGFVYTPPADANAADDGLDHFVYRVCDDPVDESEARCALGIIYVNIEKTAVAAVTPGNIIANDEDLSQGPLELPVPALPNVFVLLDDSIAMASDILTAESEGFYAVGNQTKTWFLPEVGSIRSQYAKSEAKDPGKGLWRLRNADFNHVYYDPSVTYVPWVGVNNTNTEFLDSDPSNAISDPYKTSSARIDLTSLTDNDMPDGDRDVYLAKYYTWADIDSASCPDNVVGVVDGTSPITDPGGTCTEGTLVEIKPASLGGSDTYPKGTERSDCVGSVCTYAEEIQNFANFYSYSRTRHYSSKTALGQVIAGAENMRIGFGAFGGANDNIAIAEMNESALAGNKGELLEHIYRNHAASDSTPIRDSLEQTGRYFACLNSRTIIPAPHCPVLPAPEGNCQQNFSLVVTAGFWNAIGPSNDIGNDDSDGASPFDGGRYADTTAKTLADVAMYFYERDLHPGLADEVPAMERDLAGAPASAFGGSSTRPSMHQHMSTYVVAFGVSGSIAMDMVPTDYTQAFDWGDVLTDDDKLNDLVHTAVNGRGNFLDAGNPVDLKAALENAFEQFSQAIGSASAVSFNSQEMQAGSLVFRAFYNIRDNTGDLIAQEFDGTGTVGAEVWSAAEKLDLTSYDSRQILTFDPTVTNGAGGIPFRSTSLNSQQKLALEDDPLGVIVENSAQFQAQIAKHVNYLRGDSSNERPLGNLRERPTVKGRMGDVVSSTPVFYGAPSRLRRASPPYPMSEPYKTFQNTYATRQAAVYVSSNDGMVHGFKADTGEEIFAYVPDHVITGAYSQRIKQLLSTNYSHRYTVDLSNAINDVYLDPDFRSNSLLADKEWVTMLVGGMRGGGKGYFALDVTDPGDMTESNAADVVMWEFTDEDDVHPTVAGVPVLDAAGIPVSDLGYTYSVPTIAMSNISDSSDGENEWVTVFGNGYNSTSGKAVLFVLLAGKGTDGHWCHPDKAGCLSNEYDFVKLETPAVSATIANGLGTPRAVDLDGNGTVDLAYAGDRFGNLYRFDLRDPDPANWDSTRIFEATYANPVTSLDEVQPITGQPYLVNHPTKTTGANCYTYDHNEVRVDRLCGGFIVVFTTGSYIYEGDDTSKDIQSMYGIWDRLGSIQVSKSDLVQQEYTSIENDANVGNVRILSENPVDYDTKYGWYNDLDHASADGLTDPEFPGEKAIRNIQVRGGVAFVNSVMPKSISSCSVEAGGAAHAFCPDTGTLLCVGDNGVFDLNEDDEYTAADETIDGDVVASTFFEGSVPTDSTFIGGHRVTQLSDQTLQIQGTNTSGGDNTGRISWQRVK